MTARIPTKPVIGGCAAMTKHKCPSCRCRQFRKKCSQIVPARNYRDKHICEKTANKGSDFCTFHGGKKK